MNLTTVVPSKILDDKILKMQLLDKFSNSLLGRIEGVLTYMRGYVPESAV